LEEEKRPQTRKSKLKPPTLTASKNLTERERRISFNSDRSDKRTEV